ncbi:hypothetical protein [Flavihumibacter sp. CACIAM 22H1]|uniref:hypothetical protein n=1 Tax=Flavihumibacter sp. CACIAM 22H1 TaxID=1812911 RepID=UPI0007A9225D|nr:hypothetical protein [Flavihumibacter sp. CACIAM 22H1]KYP13546.1 MAG: hypothetical protein A1D16_17460 [Flavihumibacter sp. CACIAM 22H1]
MKIIAKYILCASILFSCNSQKLTILSNDSESIEFEEVQLNKILLDPSIYNEKYISSKGYASFGFEMSAVFLDKESRSKYNSNNSIWLIPARTLTITQCDSIEKYFNNKKVRIKGKFDSKSKGHLGYYMGSLILYSIEEL